MHVNLDEAAKSPNNRLVYQKGAWTLHMLRDLIGTEPFWRGIRLYYQRHANGVASTADLGRAMEEVSGQDQRGFFAHWLTRRVAMMNPPKKEFTTEPRPPTPS